MTTGCDYTIHPVGDLDNVGYRDSDWTVIRASSNVSGPSGSIPSGHAGWWELGGFSFGRWSPIGAQAWEVFSTKGDTIEIVVNDFGPHSFQTVGEDPNDQLNCRQAHVFVGGVLSTDNTVHRADFDEIDITVTLNYDLPPIESFPDPNRHGDCDDGPGGFLNPDVDALAYFIDSRLSGKIKIINNGDPDINLVGVRLAGDDANGLSIPFKNSYLAVPWLDISISAPVASYAGTITHISADNGNTLALGHITRSDTDPNVTGLVISDPNGNIDLLPGGSMTATATIDPTDPNDNCVDFGTTITVPGAAVGDTCSPTARTATNNAIFDCRVTSASTVTGRSCAMNSAGVVTIGSTVFDIVVTGR